jgi:hypothetical protein
MKTYISAHGFRNFSPRLISSFEFGLWQSRTSWWAFHGHVSCLGVRRKEGVEVLISDPRASQRPVDLPVGPTFQRFHNFPMASVWGTSLERTALGAFQIQTLALYL